tara:strand:- start:1332 stop:1787 length:456 start_codon:yes stop_codon:yes gene_type:complete
VRPDEFQEGVDDEEHRHQQLDLPQDGQAAIQIEFAGQTAQRVGIADQRQDSTGRDHAGGCEEGRALAQAGQDIAVEDAWFPGQEVQHPFAPEPRHQHRDRGLAGRRSLGHPADAPPGGEQSQHRRQIGGIETRGEGHVELHEPGLGCRVAP